MGRIGTACGLGATAAVVAAHEGRHTSGQADQGA